jgi:hypothetical protein
MQAIAAPRKEGRMRAKLWVVAAVMGGLALPAQAHELTMSECLEGSDFIKNAALSRDYGMTREDFIGRMQNDLVLIQAFPPELRWFVQDQDDETLLVGFAESVFDSPQAPESHQSDFLAACEQRRAVHSGGAAQIDDTVLVR